MTQNTRRNGGSAIDGRTTRHPGYDWGKVIGPIRQVIVRGLDKVNALFALTMTA